MNEGWTRVVWMARRKWGWLLSIVAVCCLVIAFLLFNLRPLQHNPPLSASALSTMDVSCLGRLLPGGRVIRVAAPSGAVIGELLVQRGQWVEQGVILARLRDYSREAALLSRAEKEAAVAKCEFECVRAGEKAGTIEAQGSAIARQEAILRDEEAQYQRYRSLREKGAVSARGVEELQTRRDTARASLSQERDRLRSLKDIRKEDLALAAGKVEAAEANRKVAQESVELNLIRAPVSGRVLEVHAFAGEAVSERGLLEMGSGREMLVETEVYVSDIGRVRIGAPAVVSGDAIPGDLKGEVAEVVSMVARSDVLPTDPLAFSDRRIVKVWIRLNDSNAVADLANHQVSVVIKP